MSLEAGHRLAHYEILEPIGKGGMGEVYRAKDSKLGRDVAIKILPDELAGDEERVRRFQREAKVLASLNHPNIASIYGVEQSGDTHYLVLELVAGETLAERIARGPIPRSEALDIARQVAQALEAAHTQGIVHRDLKPANVKLTPDDTVKVLDFGLAKVFADEVPETDDSMSPTITRDATRVGVILGTAAYMSPEQAKGKPVDKRSDIFSYGVLLFEMLTGRRGFKGDDVHETLAAVINKDVEWDALASDTPSSVRRLLRRSLAKDRRERLADIADARLEIQESSMDEVYPPSVPSLASGWRRTLAVALGASAVVGAMIWNLRTPAPPVVARLAMTSPLDETVRILVQSPVLAVTPDGSKIVYVSGTSADRKLLVRSLDEISATTLVAAGTSNINTPFVSPDGEWVGYREGNALRKRPLTGGPSVKLCELSGALRGASWGEDGNIVFATQETDNLYRVDANGGEPELLPGGEGVRYRWPELLPGGKAVLHNLNFGYETRIAVLELESGEQKVLFEGDNPRYADSGHIVFGRDNGLWAVPFDADRLEVRGAPRPVVEQVFTKVSSSVDFAISRNGMLVYLPGRAGVGGRRNLVWVDRTGRTTDLGFGENSYGDANLSPDGKKLAMWMEGTTWVYDVERGARVKVTDGGIHPVWTPDGDRVVMEVIGSGLFVKSADGSGELEPLVETSALTRPGSWTQDGSAFAYAQGGESGLDIWVKSEDGTLPFIRTEHDEESPMFSPDGRWLAYVSNENGFEVFAAPFPGPGERIVMSVGGGRAPVWSPVGGELFYRDLDGRMMVVPVESGDTLTVGSPEVLFQGPYSAAAGGDPHYDVSRDGTRFLMVDESGATDGSDSRSQLAVVLNWHEELKRLVPADN